MAIGLPHIISLFKKGNVCVTGLRGTGKDMLTSNVCIRRKKQYISNMDYGEGYIPYNYDIIDLNGNTFQNMIDGHIKPYQFPFPDGTDIYLSDIGVYFPSQECSYLDRNYKGIPLFMALSRHLGECNVHLNVQNLERAWTKIREQSDCYIRTEWLWKWLLKKTGYVVQKVIIYNKGSSCQDRVPPCPYRVPIFAPRESKELYKMKIIDYTIKYGEIYSAILIYKNKSKYDTRYFKTFMEKGE